MSRIAILACVALLGMGALVVPAAAARQGGTDWKIAAAGEWEGTSRPEPPPDGAVAVSPEGEKILQPYSVFFSKDYSAVPEMTEFEPEFMIVVVQEGNFSLDARDTEPGIVVFPAAGNPIPLMQPKKANRPFYELTDPLEYVQDPSGGNCTHACPILPGTVVQLKAGDRVAAREGTLCVWCLLNSNFESTDEDDPTNNDDQGLLQVFALLPAGEDPESFSWIQSWDSDQAAVAPEIERMSGGMDPGAASSERTMLAWAFNPATKCDS